MEHRSNQEGTAQPPRHCLWHFASLLEGAFSTSPMGRGFGGGEWWTQLGVTMSAARTSDALSCLEMSFLTAGTEHSLLIMMIIKSHAPGLQPAGIRKTEILAPAHCTINWKYVEAFNLFVSLCLVPHFEGRKRKKKKKKEKETKKKKKKKKKKRKSAHNCVQGPGPQWLQTCKACALLICFHFASRRVFCSPAQQPDLGEGNGWGRHRGFAFILHQGLWLSHWFWTHAFEETPKFLREKTVPKTLLAHL